MDKDLKQRCQSIARQLDAEAYARGHRHGRSRLRRAWQWIWSLPTHLLALAVRLVVSRRIVCTARIDGVTVYGLRGDRGRGLSLGSAIFIGLGAPDTPSLAPSTLRTLLIHEFGHVVQARRFGPLYLLIYGLPSVIWAGFPYFKKRRRTRGISYYRFFTERSADRLGADHFGTTLLRSEPPSPGNGKPPRVDV